MLVSSSLISCMLGFSVTQTTNFQTSKLCLEKSEESESESRSVVSYSLRPHGLYSPWSSPGQNTGVGSLSLLQGIFPMQGSKPGLPHCKRIPYQLSHKGKGRGTRDRIANLFAGSWRKQGNSRKTSNSASLTTLKPLTCGS